MNEEKLTVEEFILKHKRTLILSCTILDTIARTLSEDGETPTTISCGLSSMTIKEMLMAAGVTNEEARLIVDDANREIDSLRQLMMG
jgi:hypothetical protein